VADVLRLREVNGGKDLEEVVREAVALSRGAANKIIVEVEAQPGRKKV
jgi:hypothetical protein